LRNILKTLLEEHCLAGGRMSRTVTQQMRIRPIAQNLIKRFRQTNKSQVNPSSQVYPEQGELVKLSRVLENRQFMK